MNKNISPKTYITILLLSLSVIIFLKIGYRLQPHNIYLSDTTFPSHIAANLLYDENINTNTWYSFSFFGKDIPTNFRTPYMFQLPGLLMLPVFYVFGSTVEAYDLSQLYMALLYIFIIFFVLRYLIGVKAAFLTSMLLASNASFIHYNLNSFISTEPQINLIFAASLLLFILSLKKHYAFILPASFFLGLGLSVKLSYISRLLAAAVLSLFFIKDLKLIFRKFHYRILLAGAACFLAGASLFIIFNLSGPRQSSFAMFKKYILKNEITVENVDNSDYMHNLALRISQLSRLVNNSSCFSDRELHNYMNGWIITKRSILFYLFWIAFFYNLGHALFNCRKRKAYARTVLSMYSFYLIIFLSSMFTARSLNEYHMSAMYPFPQLLLALFAVNIAQLSLFKDFSGRFLIYAGFFMLSINVLDSYILVKSSDCRGDRLYASKSLADLINTLGKTELNKLYLVNAPVYEQLKLFLRKDIFIVNSEHQDVPELRERSMDELLRRIRSEQDKKFLMLIYLPVQQKATLDKLFEKLGEYGYGWNTIDREYYNLCIPLYYLVEVEENDQPHEK